MPTVALTSVVPWRKSTPLRSTTRLPMASWYRGFTCDGVTGCHWLAPIPPLSGTPLTASTVNKVATDTATIAAVATSVVITTPRSRDRPPPLREPPAINAITSAKATTARPKPKPWFQWGHHGPDENRSDTAMRARMTPTTMTTMLRRGGGRTAHSWATLRPE